MFTLKSEFQLRYSVWSSIEQFEALKLEWDEMVFKNIEAKPMIQRCEQFIRVVNQAERNLAENAVVPKLKAMVWAYKEALPAVMAMRSQYLEAEHWEEIRGLMKVELNPEDPALKLKDLFSYKIT
jgi:hypothetical protein